VVWFDLVAGDHLIVKSLYQNMSSEVYLDTASIILAMFLKCTLNYGAITSPLMFLHAKKELIIYVFKQNQTNKDPG